LYKENGKEEGAEEIFQKPTISPWKKWNGTVCFQFAFSLLTE
jgi:hypothetical protein